MYRFLLVFLCIIPLAACNRSVDVQRNDDGTADITVTLTESDINSAIEAALNEGDDPLLRDPEVDLQPGRIVVSGEHDRRDGGGRVSGSITLSVTVVNGSLNVEATAIDIEGFDAGDEALQEFNERLASRLGARAGRDNSNAQLTDVTITDDNLSFTLRVSRE